MTEQSNKELQFVAALRRTSEFRGAAQEREAIIQYLLEMRDVWVETFSEHVIDALNGIIDDIDLQVHLEDEDK